MNTKIFDIELYPIERINEKFKINFRNVIDKNPTGYISFLKDGNFPVINTFEMLILSDNKIHLDDFYVDDCGELRQSVMVWDEDYWSRRKNYRKIEASLNLNTVKIPEDLILKYRQYANHNRSFDKIKVKINNRRCICRDNNNFIEEYSLLSNDKTYSENEVFDILENYDRELKLDTFAYTKPCDYTVTDWFNKNKK